MMFRSSRSASARARSGPSLPTDARYLGADLIPLDPETCRSISNSIRCRPEPSTSSAMLGVLEYLQSPDEALRKARASGRRALFSYCCLKAQRGPHPDRSKRRERGWINDWSRDELLASAGRADGAWCRKSRSVKATISIRRSSWPNRQRRLSRPDKAGCRAQGAHLHRRRPVRSL